MRRIELLIDFLQRHRKAFDIRIVFGGIVFPAVDKRNNDWVGFSRNGLSVGLLDDAKYVIHFDLVPKLSHIVNFNEGEADGSARTRARISMPVDGDFGRCTIIVVNFRRRDFDYGVFGAVRTQRHMATRKSMQ